MNLVTQILYSHEEVEPPRRPRPRDVWRDPLVEALVSLLLADHLERVAEAGVARTAVAALAVVDWNGETKGESRNVANKHAWYLHWLCARALSLVRLEEVGKEGRRLVNGRRKGAAE